MRISQFKYIISSVLLVFFLSTKVAGLHVFAHDDDDQQECHLCEFVTVSNAIVIAKFGNEDFKLTQPILPHKEQPVVVYHHPFRKTVLSVHLFSKPPPGFYLS